MSRLTDLVTRDVLEEEMPDNPLDVLQSGQASSERNLLARARELLLHIESDDLWQAVALFVAEDAVSRWGTEHDHLQMLFLARATEDGDLEAQEELRAMINSLIEELLWECRESQRRVSVGSLQDSLEFLQRILGPEFYPLLTKRSGASETTVRRWLHGGKTSWKRSYSILRIASMLWALQQSRGFSDKELLEWFSAPLHNGQSAKDIWLRQGSLGAKELGDDVVQEIAAWGSPY